jgi:hypothetical protein
MYAFLILDYILRISVDPNGKFIHERVSWEKASKDDPSFLECMKISDCLEKSIEELSKGLIFLVFKRNHLRI